MTDQHFPIGKRMTLTGAFPEPIVPQAVRRIGDRFTSSLPRYDGTPDETILSLEQADRLIGPREESRG